MTRRPACAWKFQPSLERLERRDCPTVPTAPGDYTPPPSTLPPPSEPAPTPPLAPTDPTSSPTYYK